MSHSKGTSTLIEQSVSSTLYSRIDSDTAGDHCQGGDASPVLVVYIDVFVIHQLLCNSLIIMLLCTA